MKKEDIINLGIEREGLFKLPKQTNYLKMIFVYDSPMIESDQIEFNIKLESYKTILKLINDLEK